MVSVALSYQEMKLVSEMVWTAIENGNRAEGKPFDPTPKQYEQLCGLAHRLEESIKQMQKDYGLK